MQLFYESVHIVAAPIRLTLEGAAVATKICIIIEVNTILRIRIKIIVNMQAVYIVAVYYIGRYSAYEISVYFQCRIKQYHISVFNKTVGMLFVLVRRADFGGRLGFCAKWVDPCMNLHTAVVTLFYHK